MKYLSGGIQFGVQREEHVTGDNGYKISIGITPLQEVNSNGKQN